MKNTVYGLDHLFNICKVEHFQDELASLTKMGFTIINSTGIPVTKQSNYCPFCKSVRADPQLEKFCQICDSRAGLEASRMQKPYIYLCHLNIIDVAIPITINNNYIGALMVGQIRTDAPAAVKSLEQLLSSQASRRASEHIKMHKTEYDEIPFLPFETLNFYIQILSCLTTYIVETSFENAQTLLAYKQFFQELKLLALDGPLLDKPLSIKEKISLPPIFRKTRTPPINKFSVLQPAFDYLEENISQNITQKQAAKVCNLSQSYFSRLFFQKTGENFSQYLSRKKIEMARELLKETDKSIVQISEEIGFNTPGYFIKVFKKAEGITPLQYRKYYQF